MLRLCHCSLKPGKSSMKVLFICFSYSILQGMCPKPNLWRQLRFDLALQSRAKPVSSDPASGPAAQHDMPPSATNRFNPLLLGMINAGPLRTGSLEKQARDLLTQIFRGSRPIVTDSGNGLASIQIISDDTNGDTNSRGGDSLDSVKVEEDTKQRAGDLV